MNKRLWRAIASGALLLALAFGAVGTSFYEPGGGEEQPILPGAPGDSLAGGGIYVSSWYYCFGAQRITVWLRDSVPSTVYSDTLAAVALQFTSDSLTYAGSASRWATMPLAAAALAANDTIGVSASGKLANMSLSPSTAGNMGYVAAHCWGSSPAAALVPEQFIPAIWVRLRVVNQSRKRGPGHTGNAAMLGLRARLLIFGGRPGYDPRDQEVAP